MLKVLSLALGVSIGVALFLCVQWYLFVTGTENPHDAFGTELNGMMPAAMNDWGCARLRERFETTTAPQGCKADEAGGWR